MSNQIFANFSNKMFVDLGLIQLGREDCDPSHSFGPAKRNHYLFHYVLSGRGTLIAADHNGVNHEYSIHTGQGFLISPQQVTMYIADETNPWEYVWLEFDGLVVREALIGANLTVDNPVYHANYKDVREDMKDEMIYIVDHRDESEYHLIGHLYLFLDYLRRSVEAPIAVSGNSLKDHYMHEAMTYIEGNFQNQISVEEIAVFCGLDRSYFGRIFRDYTGKSPQEFLKNYRMSKARELLKLTKLSIGDIGKLVGYPDPQHFSRAFKSVYGVSPHKWKVLAG